MDAVRMLIEAVAIELCCVYIVNKWIRLTCGSGAKPEALMVLMGATILLAHAVEGYRANDLIGAEARSASFERRSIT